MKRFSALCFALLLCLSLSVSAFAVVEQSPSYYTADYADVLSADTEQMISDYNGALEYQCRGAQIVVVTVRYLDGMYCDDYAYKLFNNWGVGSSQQNNGMLLLLATEENKAWLAYGIGLNDTLSENTVDTLLDRYFWDDFDRGNYDGAVTKLFNALLRIFDERYGSNVSGAQYAYAEQSSPSDVFFSAIGSIVKTAVFILIIISIFGRGNNRRGGGGGGGSWLPWLLLFNSARNRGYGGYNNRGGYRGGGFGGGMGHGGGGFGGGFGGHGGGFGGGMGHGGGGFGGGGGGRR